MVKLDNYLYPVSRKYIKEQFEAYLRDEFVTFYLNFQTAAIESLSKGYFKILFCFGFSKANQISDFAMEEFRHYFLK